MSINACSINAHTIDAACGAYHVLSSTVLNYTITLAPGQVVPPIDIGNFLGGPVTSIVISSGALNGPGGSLAFSTDPGLAGNIYFGGTATLTLGGYSGQVRLYGTINFVTINFLVQVVEAATGGGQQQHVHPDTKVPLNIFRRQPEPQEELVDLTKLEQEYVRVEIEFLGVTYGETLRRAMADELSFVTISDLTLDATSVNITDLKLTKGR
jgi:hypothetical protein